MAQIIKQLNRGKVNPEDIPLAQVVRGNLSAPILVIVDPPNPKYWLARQPLSINNQGVLRDACVRAGISSSQLCIIAAAPSIPEDMYNSDKKKAEWLAQFKEQFEELVGMSEAKAVVLMGNLAARQYLGRATKITKVRGLVLPGRDDRPYLPTYSLAYTTKFPEYQPTLNADFATLKRLVDSSYEVSGMARDGIESGYTYTYDLSTLIANKPKMIAIDTETTGLGWYKDDVFPFLLQICDRPGRAFLVPLAERYAVNGGSVEDLNRVYQQAKTLLEDPTIIKIGHNLKFDILMLRKIGINVRGWKHDTMQMAYTLDENLRNYGLDDCVRMYVPEMAGYCVAPETKILTSDMRWVEAGSLTVGDSLVGFDEYPAKYKNRRRMVESMVQEHRLIQKPCYKLTFASGKTITVSDNHQFLIARTKSVGGRYEWAQTKDLSVGQKLKGFPQADECRSYESGWFSGILDGEGWVTGKGTGGNSFRVGFAQVDGLVLARGIEYLKSKGIRHSVSTNNRNKIPVHSPVALTWDAIKLLQICRPERLVSSKKWQGCPLPCSDIDYEEIVSKEFVGVKEVVAMTTSSHTFIADGICSHNSDELQRSYDKDKMIEVPPEIMKKYAGGDVDACVRLYRALLPRLKADPRHYRRYTHIAMPALYMFAKFTEPCGLGVDIERLNAFKETLLQQQNNERSSLLRRVPRAVRVRAIEDAKSRLSKAKAAEYNSDDLMGSPKFIRDVLFSKEGFGLTPIVFTKANGEPSTSTKDHLVYFEDEYEWVRDYIEFVKLKKMVSTYVEDFDRYIAADGKIHPSFHMHRTNTGRVASSDPNGQNIPKRGELAKAYRKMFIPTPGFKIIEADYAQVELKIAAVMSKDPDMINAYLTDGDLHTLTAALTMGLSVQKFRELPKDVQKQKRFEAKAINFGFIYGMSAKGFRTYAKTMYGIDYTEAQAEQFRRAFFTRYQRLLTWHESTKQFAHKHGYVQSLHGVKRHLPSISSKDRAAVALAERQALNAPVQLLGSDLNLMAAVRFSRDVDPNECRVILVVHDAIVVEAIEGKEEYYASVLKWYMENNPVQEWFGFSFPIPLTAEIAIGDNYGDTEEESKDNPCVPHCPEWYDRERDLMPPLKALNFG